MKKVLSIILLLSISCLLYAGSIREYVCIVRENISEKNIQFLDELADNFNHSGYSRYADYIGTFKKGSFGSGFVTYLNGTPYLVTNRHVVESGETANISFENDDGSTSDYKNLKILFVDEDVDLAVIELPVGFKRAGLNFSSSTVQDGDDVWSAGYPGLANEPSWQLGKGIVSNSRAKIKQLLDPSISVLIQHTAEVDGGNSGGPLLVKASGESSGYKVVGINTWKAIYRENTNFAIPSALVKKTVEKGIVEKKTQSLDDRLKAFLNSFKGEDVSADSVCKFVSNQMAETYGRDSFVRILGYGSTSDRNMVSKIFASNPIEGLRTSIACEIFSDFSGNDYSVSAKNNLEDSTEVVFENEDKSKKILCYWVEDKGLWRLSKVDTIKNKDEKKKEESKKNGSYNKKFVQMGCPFMMDFSGGVLFPVENCHLGCDIEAKFVYKYVYVGLFGTYQIADTKTEDDYGYSTMHYDYTHRSFGLVGGLSIPVQISNFTLMPFGEVRFGFSNFMLGFDTMLTTGAAPGVEFIYKFSDEFGLGVGAKYQFTNYGMNTKCESVIVNISLFTGNIENMF